MIDILPLNSDRSWSDLLSLSREFFAEYEVHHPDFFKIADLKDEHITSYFASFCGNESRAAFIAVDGGRIVGYISVNVKEQPEYWQVEKVGEISGLMVSRDYRRRGVARKLLGKAVEFFKSHCVKYYTVYTAVENQAGVDFYAACSLTPLYTTMIGKIP